MSELTKNFDLIKPTLSDAADFTAMNNNWDKIDNQLGQSRIQSYTALEQFGLSDSEMNPTDFTGNIDKIITTLDGYAAEMMFIVQNDVNPNLHASLIQKMNADTTITFSANSHAGWLFIRFSGEAYRPTLIETNLETAKYYDSIWTCVYNKGATENQMSAFKTVADITPGGVSVIPVASGGTGGDTPEKAINNLGIPKYVSGATSASVGSATVSTLEELNTLMESGRKCAVTFGAEITVRGVAIPCYSKGFVACFKDSVFMVVDNNGYLYHGYYTDGGTWGTIRTSKNAGTAGVADIANKVAVSATSDNKFLPVMFDSGVGQVAESSEFGYNPSTKRLSVKEVVSTTFMGNLTGNVNGNVNGNVSGTATKLNNNGLQFGRALLSRYTKSEVSPLTQVTQYFNFLGSLAEKFIIAEISMYENYENNEQLIGKFRTNAFNVLNRGSLQYEDYKYDIIVNGVEFRFFPSYDSIGVQAKGQDGSEIRRYYISAFYEEL